MQTNYHINVNEGKAGTITATERLALIERLTTLSKRGAPARQKVNRNLFTRTIDRLLALARKYAPPVHWLGATLTAVLLYLYARLVALTAHLRTAGEIVWPDLSPGCVLALWHRDAPTLLVAFVLSRPKVPCSIMISADPRGDCLAMLCRFVGLHVVRGGSDEGGWPALVQLSETLISGSCVFITADGGGPAGVAKVGAVALASAVSVPVVPLVADCSPALEERHKWDRARNPLPFCTIIISLGTARTFDPLCDAAAIERARRWMEENLKRMSLESHLK